jgi:hypothetical protein
MNVEKLPGVGLSVGHLGQLVLEMANEHLSISSSVTKVPEVLYGLLVQGTVVSIVHMHCDMSSCCHF